MYDLPDNRGVKLYPELVIHVNMIIRRSRYPMVIGKKSTKVINNIKYYYSLDEVIDQHIPLTYLPADLIPKQFVVISMMSVEPT